MIQPSSKSKVANTPSAIKKDIQKLQRAIVDGLEDVKAQDIVVFDTESLSPLFERVIIASGSSNRQTKALSSSVLDAVREAGFEKPRVEGETNGEWIIVDCGQAVVHIMQPSFRAYYNLEELWGDKPVRLKLGAAKPAPSKQVRAVVSEPNKPTASLRRSSAVKKAHQQIAAAKTSSTAAARRPKSTAKSPQAAGKQSAGSALAKGRVKTVVVNTPKPPAKRGRAAPAPAKKSRKA